MKMHQRKLHEITYRSWPASLAFGVALVWLLLPATALAASVLGVVEDEKATAGSLVFADNGGSVFSEEFALDLGANDRAARMAGSLACVRSTGDQKVWELDTSVDVFRASYENGGLTTVASHDAAKVVAPGTSGTYAFEIRNEGMYVTEYRMGFSGGFARLENECPIEVRLAKNEVWESGGSGEWARPSALSEMVLGSGYEAGLAAGDSDWFVLEWRWLYEGALSGEDDSDEADTRLGSALVPDWCELRIEVVSAADLGLVENSVDNASDAASEAGVAATHSAPENTPTYCEFSLVTAVVIVLVELCMVVSLVLMIAVVNRVAILRFLRWRCVGVESVYERRSAVLFGVAAMVLLCTYLIHVRDDEILRWLGFILRVGRFTL